MNKLIPIAAPDGERSIVAITGLSRSTVYAEIKAGRLKTVTVGSRRFSTDRFLDEYVSALEGGSSAPPAA